MTMHSQRPRVGIPWRTALEEAAHNLPKIVNYYRAVEAAGGVPVTISLRLDAADLAQMAESLDALVLPGSPADVDPGKYHAMRHAETADADPDRERTDFALLEHALAQQKPVLAICYGVQSLNVYLGGTLIQDIPSELHTEIRHSRNGLPAGFPDPRHPARLEADSRLAALVGAMDAEVNSSHHQAIAEPGRELRIVARAPDGVVEAVEYVAGEQWVLGVQWHPERLPGDRVSEALFRGLVAAASAAVER